MHTTPRAPAWRLPLATLALAVSSAWAAPVIGPSDASFFDPPTSAPTGRPGDLIRYRPTTLQLGAHAPSTKAFTVIYQSTDSLDKANVVSGTVIVPNTAWTGGGNRPVVVYAVGTHGLANHCAPSRELQIDHDYEAANMVDALNAGYAVLVPDYAGYLNGQSPTFMAGKAQGQAVLDLIRAAGAIPSVGIGATSRLGIWGYSQGAQSAAWAGELLPTYAPELKVAGVAFGGTPGDFPATARALDGNIGFAFLGMAVSGLGVQYPGTIGRNFNLLASDEGKQAIARLQGECMFESLFDLPNGTLSSFTVDPANITLDDILGVPAVGDTLRAQSLGTHKIPVPVYQFHAQADEFIPLDQAYALKKTYCALGSTVAFDLYKGEHVTTMTQGARQVLAWMADRFEGRPAPNTCDTSLPDPVPTANPGGGNFVVTLDQWPLDAKIGLKTLGQTISLPADSTLRADADVTARTLTGQLHVPDFKASVKLLGLPVPIGLKVVPANDVEGSASVDNNGVLHIHGAAPVNITISSVLGIPFGACKTASPVTFPIDFDGPVSSLGNGGLRFEGTVAFPQIKGCLISGLLSALMSGQGQTFSFMVAPPAPTAH